MSRPLFYAWKRCVSSCFFFFSSRRRHTRLQGDWSSDVCSSDLQPETPARSRARGEPRKGVFRNLAVPFAAEGFDALQTDRFRVLPPTQSRRFNFYGLIQSRNLQFAFQKFHLAVPTGCCGIAPISL